MGGLARPDNNDAKGILTDAEIELTVHGSQKGYPEHLRLVRFYDEEQSREFMFLTNAKVLYELREVKAPYWFNNAEVARIQELNQNYMGQTDIAAIIKACFRKPEEGEKAQAMNSAQMLATIQNEFPSVKATHSMKVHLGLAMKELEYEHSDRGHVAYYKVIPLKVA